MYGYIYLTTNNINNKKYIGKHKSPCFDKKYYGSGKLLVLAIRKYGKANFTVRMIDTAETKEELDVLEKKHIKENDAMNNEMFYNIAAGGEGQSIIYPELKAKLLATNLGSHDSEETKRKKSEAHKGERNYLYGKHPSEEARKNMSEAQKRRASRDDYVNPWKGHVYTEEEKAQRSKTLTGRKQPKEVAEKVAKTHWIEIYCVTNDTTYPSIQHASAATGVDGSDISKICRGKKEQAKGYKFEYRGKPLNRQPKRKD